MQAWPVPRQVPAGLHSSCHTPVAYPPARKLCRRKHHNCMQQCHVANPAQPCSQMDTRLALPELVERHSTNATFASTTVVLRKAVCQFCWYYCKCTNVLQEQLLQQNSQASQAMQCIFKINHTQATKPVLNCWYPP